MLPGPLHQQSVQVVQHPGTVFARQLTQRGRMRHGPILRNVTKAAPVQAIRHFADQRLIAKPIPVLEVHQPQIRLHGNSRPPDVRVEPLSVGLEESLIRQPRIDDRQFVAEGLRLKREEVIPHRLLRFSQPQHGRPPQESECGARRSSIGIPSLVSRTGDGWRCYQFDSP